MELVNPLTTYRADNRYLRLTKDVACLSTDSVGDFVCIRGDRVNGKWRVQRADPHDISKMPAIGVLISKSTPTVGVIQMYGACDLFSGLDFTRHVYLLGPSGIQDTLPSVGVNGYVMVQQVGKPVASDVLWLTNDIRMAKRISS